MYMHDLDWIHAESLIQSNTFTIISKSILIIEQYYKAMGEDHMLNHVKYYHSQRIENFWPSEKQLLSQNTVKYILKQMIYQRYHGEVQMDMMGIHWKQHHPYHVANTLLPD